MDEAQLIRLIESLLFVADGALELARLEDILEVERSRLEVAIAALAASSRSRGLVVQRFGDAVQMVTAPEAAPYVERLLGVQASSRLSTAALETLGIVAYRQPITRAGVEAVRGVNCDRALATLQSRGMIAKVGRMEAVGRPILYGTTFEFLQRFGLQSLGDLPALEDPGLEEVV